MRILVFLFLLLAGISFVHAETDRNASNPTERAVDDLNRLITRQQGQDPEQVRINLKKLSRLAAQTGNNKGLMHTYYQWAIYYNLQGEYDSLKVYAERCLALGKRAKLPQAEAFGNQLMGTYHWQTGFFDKATASHFKALKTRQAIRDSSGIASSLLSLGGVLLSTNKLENAREYLNDGLHLARKVKDDLLILRGLHTLANLHGMQGNYEDALKADAEALGICKRTGNMRGYSEIYSNMALCYFYQGKLDQSLEFHQKVLAIDQFFKDDKQIGDTYLNIAQIFRKKKQFHQSAELLSKAISLFEKTNYKYGLKDAYHSLSEIHKEEGNFKQAYLDYQQYHKVDQELTNDINSKNIERLNVQYETEQRDQKIRSLSQEAAIQKLELKERNLFLLIAAVLLTSGVILAYLFYRQHKLKEAGKLSEAISRQQQIAAQAILNAEEQERRRIAGELHDGVGQTISGALINLNILFEKLQLTGAEQKLAASSLASLSEGYDELRAISHQMVPPGLQRRGFKAALNDLLQRIDQGKLKTRLELSGFETPLNGEVESALFRIIQETLANVLKHAEATKFSIQLLRDEEGIFLSMEDNGKGFDLSEQAAFGGVGLKNMRSRVEFLRGVMEIESRPGKGTVVVIHIPNSEGQPVSQAEDELLA